MFWALFVLGHDCGHGSFSSSRRLNDAVGHALHSFILVPYHGWRLSHKKHHGNHGHVENDESWTPLTKSQWDVLVGVALLELWVWWNLGSMLAGCEVCFATLKFRCG